MKLTRFLFPLLIAFVLLIPRLILAGTLDAAPFRIVVPSSEWRIDNPTVQAMGGNISIVATISNTNKVLRSVVSKMVLKDPSPSSLENLCSGMRDPYTNSPTAKLISEVDTTFLGFKAKALCHEVTKGKQKFYSETIVFVVDRNGWGIACFGRPDQKDEIKKMFDFYEKRGG